MYAQPNMEVKLVTLHIHIFSVCSLYGVHYSMHHSRCAKWPAFFHRIFCHIICVCKVNLKCVLGCNWVVGE